MKRSPAPAIALEPEVARARSPKWLALMLLAYFGYEPPTALATGSLIDVLGRLAVSDHAVRSTLSRMVDSGLLQRHRKGRETYYALTPHAYRTLREGNALAWRETSPEWDGTWTVVSYSIPEDQRALRHRVRSRLAWGGFGMLRSGLWIAPRSVSVATLLENLDVLDEVRVFFGRPAEMTSTFDLIQEAYDLEEIAGRYARFIDRWTGDCKTSMPDELCAFLLLRGEWQQLVQADPRLPADQLPGGWPAADAERLFKSLYLRLETKATQIAERVLVRRLVEPREPAAQSQGTEAS